MSNRGRVGWRGRGNYRGRGGGRDGGNGGAGGKPGKVRMTFVNSRLHLSLSYNKTLIDHVRTIEVKGSKNYFVQKHLSHRSKFGINPNEGRQWQNEDKCWSVSFEKKVEY